MLIMTARLMRLGKHLLNPPSIQRVAILTRYVSDGPSKGDTGRRSRKITFESSEEEQDRDDIPDREFVDMTLEDFKDIIGGDKAVEDKISTILSEYEHLKYESIGRVPSVINEAEMLKLLEEGNNTSSRGKLFNFFYKREMDRRQSLRRRLRDKEEARLKREARALEAHGNSMNRSGLLSEDGKLLYGLWHNSLFTRIPEQKLKTGLSDSRLRTASLFGRKLIFDFSYEEFMSQHTSQNSVDQIQEAYGLNRYDYKEPFDLWFCNFDEKSFTGQYMINNALVNLHKNSMITVKPDCMTNHFDKSRLVYLSPNAKEPLGQVLKSDDVYIIGVYNDKGKVQPVSLRKANKLGIRTKCLPIDDHLLWQGPNKALCINHVVGILLEVLSNGNDWHGAMTKHIPPRKIKPMEMVIEEENRRKQRMMKVKRKEFSLRFDFD